jgi:FixJ family two-component response regulator
MKPVVFIVEDDPSVRSAITRLIQSEGFEVEAFASAEEFLPREPTERPACLVLDIRLPGASGLDLQRQLSEAAIHIPIIFISAYCDEHKTARAMKAGAVAFLTKPFPHQDLLDAVHSALRIDLAGARRN